MKQVVFHFDVVSPFAYLAFERLPQVLEGCSIAVDYRPMLFAAALKHHGQKGPAEVDSKRAWTFRHVHWLAHRHGIVLQTPAVHPFNPLPLLRLALACGSNRRVVEALFRHVWIGGHDAQDTERLAELTARLEPPVNPSSEPVKQMLRGSTDAAIADGVFGVPTFVLDGRHFWGLDSLEMLRGALQSDPWFDGPSWHDEGASRPGVKRPN